jgi:G6PDH family F420-dependent oxidoreductase
VTCPTVRIHPAIIAQAAATSQQLMGGRFALGVGSGEALNEHILGDRWPPVEQRLEMLEEAIHVIRTLWQGQMTSHYGRHYTVENARLYTLPDKPPPILISGFGEKSIEVAARIADGFITTKPDADALEQYRKAGGRGLAQAGVKVCYAASEDAARKLVHHLWRNQFLPGQLAQDLALPLHFEQASELVTEDMVSGMALGPDPKAHIEAITAYVDAGFDEVYVAQIGPDQQGMVRFYEREVLPHFA